MKDFVRHIGELFQRIELSRYIELLAILFLLAAGTLGVLVSVLDFIGANFESGPWEWVKGPTSITLLIVSFLAIGLGLERLVRFQQIVGRLNAVEQLVIDNSHNIIHALNGVETRQFDDTTEFYKYVIRRMQEAKKTVDDLTWGPAERGATYAASKATEKYVHTISAVASKKNITYREIMSFSVDDHLTRIDRAKSMLDQNLIAYQLRYYEFSQETMPPLLLLMIIDSEEVILASGGASGLFSERETRLAVRHPGVVKLFQEYYDTIWQSAKVLKEGNRIDYAALKDIRERLSKHNILE
jgi:hypothetical protein